MISNPINFYIDGNNTKKFVYEGGKTLYHFSPYDNKLSGYYECNVVFFANNKDHAKNVLRRMFEHVISCSRLYVENKKKDHDEWGFIDEAKKRVETYSKWLKDLKSGKVKITEAPTNQFYIVSWASNDVIR